MLMCVLFSKRLGPRTKLTRPPKSSDMLSRARVDPNFFVML